MSSKLAAYCWFHRVRLNDGKCPLRGSSVRLGRGRGTWVMGHGGWRGYTCSAIGNCEPQAVCFHIWMPSNCEGLPPGPGPYGRIRIHTQDRTRAGPKCDLTMISSLCSNQNYAAASEAAGSYSRATRAGVSGGGHSVPHPRLPDAYFVVPFGMEGVSGITKPFPFGTNWSRSPMTVQRMMFARPLAATLLQRTPRAAVG